MMLTVARRSLTLRAMSNLAPRRLEGKVAIVTASSDGIGYSIAKKLAIDGAKVMVSSRKLANVERAVEQLRKVTEAASIEGMVCHVGQDEHRKKLVVETVSKFGKLDIVVCNAAVNPTMGPTLDAPASAWDKIFDVNVKGAALLVKEAHPYLVASRVGSVVFVSSLGGYVPFSLLGAYCTSKTALFGLTKALVEELGRDNIRVNCIAPGLIKTNFSSALWKNKTLLEEFERRNPLGRIGEPDECAGAVSFLCSEDASYITGETIVIAGGDTSHL